MKALYIVAIIGFCWGAMCGWWIGWNDNLMDKIEAQIAANKCSAALHTINTTGEMSTLDDYETCKMRVRFMAEEASATLVEIKGSNK